MFTQLLIFIFLSTLLLSAILFFVFQIYTMIIGHLKGAPFVPSKRDKIETMLKLAEIKPEERVVDLGSGSGSLLYRAARLKAYATGIEINPFLVFYTRAQARRLGLNKNIKMLYGDFRKLPLNNMDIVFLYLWPSTNKELRQKLSRELKQGSRVVSNTFKIEGWKHEKEENGVFLYRI